MEATLFVESSKREVTCCYARMISKSITLEKAFGHVASKLLLWTLTSPCVDVEAWGSAHHLGYVQNLVRVICQCREEFGVGLHQGTLRNPLLFILVLETLSRKFHTGVSWELF